MPTETTTVATVGIPTIQVGHRGHGDHPDGGSVFLGICIGAGAVLLRQRLTKRRARMAELLATERRSEPRDSRYDSEVAELARRTATLERIVTDPAHRVDREIEALR